MRLTIYGRSVVIKALVLTLVIDVTAILVPVFVVKLVLLGVSVMLFGFVLYFFRDPLRTLPEGIKENEVISPADGRVMLIEEVEEDTFLKSKAKLVGIFLSPLDVHVNRIPVSGIVEYYQYVKGGYKAAFRHSSKHNERTEIGIANPKFRILFKQIAGFVARRIVCTLRTGRQVRRGEKFGMIKFGSRADVLLPAEAVIKVSVRQKVIGGRTVIAEVPE